VLKYPAIFHGSLCDAVREDAALRVFVHSGQLVEDRVVARITRDQLEALHSLLQERLAKRTALHGRKLRFVLGAVAILRSKGEAVAQGGDAGAS
jgi:hypothetical protein